MAAGQTMVAVKMAQKDDNEQQMGRLHVDNRNSPTGFDLSRQIG